VRELGPFSKIQIWSNRRLIAAPFKRSPKQFFVGKRTVDLGGIEESAPEFKRLMDSGNRLGLVGFTTGIRHTHCTRAPQPISTRPSEPSFRFTIVFSLAYYVAESNRGREQLVFAACNENSDRQA
jgi:hypothetical protein